MRQRMKKLTFLTLAGTCLALSNCAGIPGESPEHMRERMARQDNRVDKRQEKRNIRTEAADRRYDAWWDGAMGKNENGW